MSGEWLTLGQVRHECQKPLSGAIERAGAVVGALWRCAECGLVWELSQEMRPTPDRDYGVRMDFFWTWTEYQQADKGPVWPA